MIHSIFTTKLKLNYQPFDKFKTVILKKKEEGLVFNPLKSFPIEV